ncbi:MAG: Cache 3/Cache 2 fusion domain-containing protein [Campylobacterales bacterium]|nr:Cache 3/Cache 2 fusion domain-containing protein [Campylobacterales bacterium]
MNSVVKKVSIFQAISIILILVFAVFSITLFVQNFITSNVKSDFQKRVSDIRATFEVLNNSIVESAKTASNVFESKFSNFEIDYDTTVEINSVKTATLKSNGVILNKNNDFIDEFTKITGAVATVFVKHENDFFRIATSLKKEDDSRAMGTLLTSKSPAFEKS